MCAVPFDGINKDMLSSKQLRHIQQLIKQRIPTGGLICRSSPIKSRRRRKLCPESLFVTGRDAHQTPLQGAEQTLDKISNTTAPSKYLEAMMSAPNIAKQLGTLGGGNHFLEVSCL